MVQDNNYTILHCHTMLSNATTTIDSVTTFQEYIDKAKECNMSAFAISEHGSCFEWYHKKEAIEKAGMKYIHAVEAYITESLDEKIRDNYHCLLIALNYDGVKEINRMVSKSFYREDNHFYYSPRITYDELKATSDNIIICTACLGGILNKGNENIQQDFLQFIIKNKHRCYLEIQHHLVDAQIEYNKKLIELANTHDLQLVATTDTHCLNESHVKGRSILQKSKKIYFEDEEGWDLTFKTYDELCKLFKLQGIDEYVYLQALDNTNIIADKVKEFTLDKNTKYPKIYDNSEEAFKQKINEGYLRNPYIKNRYNFKDVQRVYREEFDVYKATKSIDFMLLQTYIREWEETNGIQCGYGRGSASGSMIAYTLGITQMDSLKFNLNFFRFQNPSRVTNCDIDTDYYSKDREKVKYFLLHDHMNLDNIQTSEIITFNTIATKGAVRDVCRAILPDDEYLGVSSIISKMIDDDNESVARQEYPQIFEYVDIINGTVVSIGSHPSGVLVTDKNIAEEIGTCSLSTSDYPVSMLNMKELDALMYIKLDILGLDNIGIINETCKLLNISRLTPDNVDLDDEQVWKSIRDDTTLIFQWESESAQNYLKKFMSNGTINLVKEKIKKFSYIKWFSFGNGLIRPACANYRYDVAQGLSDTTNLKELDEFLSPTLGHVTMQEDIMQFLVKFCGYSDAESDTVRRGIAKKYGTEKLLPEIEHRFIEYSSQTYGIPKEKCAEIIKPFLQTILQASSYAFSWNHSDAYSCIGYICGYLRYYYPLEFLASSLNIFKDKEDKTLAISEYAKKIGIKISSPKFRYSQNEYLMDKSTNSIYKGLASIKDIGKNNGDELFTLKDNTYPTFIHLLKDIREKTKVNSKQLDILIKLDFFSEFGDIYSLLYQTIVYDKFGTSKVITKANLSTQELQAIQGCYNKETEKQYREIDNIKFINNLISQNPTRQTTIQDKIKWQSQLLGYIDIVDINANSNICIVEDIEINRYGTPFATLYQLCSGVSKNIKVDKKQFNKFKIIKGDMIECLFKAKAKYKKTGVKQDGSPQFAKTGEMEKILGAWALVNE